MEESVPTAVALVAAVALALVHLFAGALRFLEGVPRSRWLSAAAGMSVAYVFVHLLPEIAAAQRAVEEGGEGLFPFLEDHVYLIALAGLALFYVVEQVSVRSRHERHAEEGEDQAGPLAFRLSVASFAVYNAAIGYLLVHGEADTVIQLALFTIALGVHFVINDFGLREHHKKSYDHIARWILAATIVLGWLLGELTEISEAALGMVIAFIGGGVILNVLKEELPKEKRASLGPFLLGAVFYAVLLELI